MRIGFDVSPLVRPHPRGIVRVVAGLVRALESRAALEIVRLAPDAGSSGTARWRQVELPRAAERLGLDGVHSPLSAFALRGSFRRAQTIHELPWLHGVGENAGWRHRAWARFGPARADVVFTATETTAREIRARSLAAAERVRVAAWGVDDVFRADHGVAALEALAIEPRSYVLAAGATREKKELDLVCDAVERVAALGGRALAVVVTGARTPYVDAVASRHPRVVLHAPGELDDVALATFTRHAACSAVLSRSEGFALPVAEALACGTAVVVPAASAQAEVGGPCATIAADRTPASVAAAIARAIDDANSVARAAHGARFTWDRCATIVERAWLELA